jgi:hypothetical protein
MADTFTTNLNLTKPEPGAAEDTWGISLNADLDALDAIFSSSGTQINLNPNQVNFGDNKKAVFGAGSDLQIYHDGTHSYIEDAGTGQLRLQSDLVALRTTNGETSITATQDAGVSIRHNNITKLATTSTGIDVTGTVVANDLTLGDASPTINFNDSDLANLNHYITSASNANLYYAADSAAVATGKHVFTTQNIERFEISSTGIDVTGVITTDGLTTSADINFGDNDKAVFGAGSDLQIYHDGSNSFVADAGTGQLRLLGDDVRIMNAAGTEISAQFIQDGEARLKYNNSTKLATKTGGIDVTGTATMDGLTVYNSGSGDAEVVIRPSDSSNDPVLKLKEDTAATRFTIRSDESDSAKVKFQTDNTEITRLAIDQNGDISFYEDTGTTAKFFWDASDERLGIGTSSPDFALSIGNDSDAFNYVSIRSSNTGNAGYLFSDAQDADVGYINYSHTTNHMGFGVNGSERMRIDSSGNLLVGKTSANLTTTGVEIDPNGILIATKNAGTVAYFNRLTTDGTILDFRKDGSPFGSIGVSGVDLIIDSPVTDSAIAFQWDDGGTTRKLQGYQTAFRMNTANDAAVDLGGSSSRWKDLYLSGAANVGSLTVDGGADGSTSYTRFTEYSSGYGFNGAYASYKGSSNELIFGRHNTFDSLTSNDIPVMSIARATGDISFYDDTGTSQALYWDASAERLGIGTTSPSELLHVHQASTSVARMRLSNTEGYLEIGTNNQVMNLDSQTHTFRNEAGSTEYMRIDSSGNVGIGDTSPSSIVSDVSTLSLNGTNTGVSGGIIYKVNGSIKGYHYVNSGNILHQAASGIGHRFLANDTDAMTINTSGSVGIGTTSPSANLHVSTSSGDCTVLIEAAQNASGSEPRLQLKGTNTSSNPIIEFGDSAGFAGSIEYENSDNSMRLGTNGSERLRIDANGNLLVGSTVTTLYASGSNGATGVQLVPNGASAIARNGGVLLYMNRTNSDGDILVFRKDGSTVGSIGNNGNRPYFASTNCGIRLGAADLLPATSTGVISDNVVSLGSTSGRFKDLYLSGAANVGSVTATGNITAFSDERLKDNIETLQGSKVLDMRGVSYTKDGEVSSGVIAQEIEKVAPELVHTAKDEMGTKSVAYGNLVGYLIEAIKDQQKQINDLKERLDNGTS